MFNQGDRVVLNQEGADTPLGRPHGAGTVQTTAAGFAYNRPYRYCTVLWDDGARDDVNEMLLVRE